MDEIKIADVKVFVEENIISFHSKRLQNLKDLKLNKILNRKNPFLLARKFLVAKNLPQKALI